MVDFGRACQMAAKQRFRGNSGMAGRLTRGDDAVREKSVKFGGWDRGDCRLEFETMPGAFLTNCDASPSLPVPASSWVDGPKIYKEILDV